MRMKERENLHSLICLPLDLFKVIFLCQSKSIVECIIVEPLENHNQLINRKSVNNSKSLPIKQIIYSQTFSNTIMGRTDEFKTEQARRKKTTEISNDKNWGYVGYYNRLKPKQIWQTHLSSCGARSDTKLTSVSHLQRLHQELKLNGSKYICSFIRQQRYRIVQ